MRDRFDLAHVVFKPGERIGARIHALLVFRLTAELPREAVDPADFDRFVDRVRNQDENPFLDVSGPPNVLLHNLGGGRFEVVRNTGDLAVMRNTYQATWSDYDGGFNYDPADILERRMTKGPSSTVRAGWMSSDRKSTSPSAFAICWRWSIWRTSPSIRSR